MLESWSVGAVQVALHLHVPCSLLCLFIPHVSVLYSPVSILILLFLWRDLAYFTTTFAECWSRRIIWQDFARIFPISTIKSICARSCSVLLSLAHFFWVSSPFCFLRDPLVPEAGVSSSKNGSGINFGGTLVTFTYSEDFALPALPLLLELPATLDTVFFLITCTISSLLSSNSFRELTFFPSPLLPPAYFFLLTNLCRLLGESLNMLTTPLLVTVCVLSASAATK